MRQCRDGHAQRGESARRYYSPRDTASKKRLKLAGQHLLKDDTQVYKQFVENESFKRFVGDMVYALTSSLF
jgi:hypothetical protein